MRDSFGGDLKMFSYIGIGWVSADTKPEISISELEVKKKSTLSIKNKTFNLTGQFAVLG